MKSAILKNCFVSLVPLALLAGCGNDLSGTYSDEREIVELTFEGDKVYTETFGATTAMPYSIDGDRLLLGNEGAQQVWKIADDGSLEGPAGIVLVKRD